MALVTAACQGTRLLLFRPPRSCLCPLSPPTARRTIKLCAAYSPGSVDRWIPAC